MAVCVVFGSEQSPLRASFAKHSLLLAGFWKNFFAAENYVCGFNENNALLSLRTTRIKKTDSTHRTSPKKE
jgi:hypothetical protein